MLSSSHSGFYFKACTILGLASASLGFSGCGSDSNTADVPLVADIRADTNRDGVVDISGATDIEGKASWTSVRGAILLPNIGDAGRRCPNSSDTTKSDKELEACHDAADDLPRAPEYFAPLQTLPVKGATASTTGTVKAVGLGADKVRIFIRRANQWVYLGSQEQLTAAELESGAVFGVDARDVVRDSAQWDGRVTITFTLINKDVVVEDSVKFRVAPLLTFNHLQKATQLFVPQSGERVVHKQFVTDLKAELAAVKFSGTLDVLNTTDNWAQDFVEFAYLAMPKPNNETAVIKVAIRSSQPGRVGGRAVFDLRGPGWGAVQIGGAGYHQVDSFGNLETIPPYEYAGKSYPAGRIIYGDAGDGISPHKDWRTFFAAQEDQAPIVLDTSWLAIGHVDEFIQFVPADTARGWKVAIKDTRAAIALLKKAEAEGHGGVLAYSREGVSNKTISDLLNDNVFLNENATAAAAIDANLAIIKRETGIADSEVLSVPGLFSAISFDGADLNFDDFPPVSGDEPIVYGPGVLVASHPAAINGIVIDRKHYFSPRQFGPVINGVDILQQGIDQAYAQVGMQVNYIDDWRSHHNWAGEIHCGTNAVRVIDKHWWQANIK